MSAPFPGGLWNATVVLFVLVPFGGALVAAAVILRLIWRDSLRPWLRRGRR